MGTWRLRLPSEGAPGKGTPIAAEGYMRLPAIPALLEDHVERVVTTFAQLGSPLGFEEHARLHDLLRRKIDRGFKRTPYAGVVVLYNTPEPPSTGMSFRIELLISTIVDEYAGWIRGREEPLFGAHPDAKVMALAQGLGPPAAVPVLDVGAGTGRNALPLAMAGYPTHAIELSPDLTALLRREIASRGLDVQVLEGNILGEELVLRQAHYRLIIACELVSHFRDMREMEAFLRRTTRLLAADGLLVFSVFLCDEDYEPDAMALELSQAQWCTLFSRSSLFDVTKELDLDLVSDESVYDYEGRHLPRGVWPSTAWFPDWCRGLDLFDLPAESSPIEMRWLVFRRR
jgi:2-polyprenyl-3-methyl-5-hydroxy-6-metoxy-1,4-benzoquinol methylase